MNPLTPKQSASIAKNVYLVQAESMNEVYQSASISGLGNLFVFKGGQIVCAVVILAPLH